MLSALCEAAIVISESYEIPIPAPTIDEGHRLLGGACRATCLGGDARGELKRIEPVGFSPLTARLVLGAAT